MKRNKGIYFAICLLIIFINCGKAQQERGQIVINAGVGYSPGFDGYLIGYGSGYPIGSYINYPNFQCSSIIPNIGATIDYGLSKKVSLGIGASYQSEITIYRGGLTDKITRINMATRFLDHLNKKNSRFDHYIGLRIGCSYWEDVPLQNNTSPIFGMPFIDEPNLFVFSFQFLYGMRIYFTDDIGFHFEVGIGSPYLVEGGLTFRFNTSKSTPRENTPPQENYGGHQVK